MRVDQAQSIARSSRRVGIRSSFGLACSVAFLVLVAGCALFGGALMSRPAGLVSLENKLISPGGSGSDGYYLLGTDALGRDMASRLVEGSRVSLIVGVSVVLISALVGTVLGLIAAFYGRRTDAVIMRLADAQVAFPGLVFIILMISMLGPSVGFVIAVLSFYGWMIFTRLVRSQSMQLKQAAYFQAAEVMGTGRWRLVKLYALPALFAPLMTQGLLDLARLILAEASLSYLGLGIQPPNVSWGIMVAENQRYMASAWWTVLFPGLAVTFTVLSVNVVANWLVARRTTELTAGPDEPVPADADMVQGPVLGSANGHHDDLASVAGRLPPSAASSLLSVTGLTVDFTTESGRVAAVRGVSFDIAPGEVLAIVGESGSGKTSTATSVVDALPPAGAIRSGTFAWKGRAVSAEQRRALRGSEIGFVFQDPVRRLNPLISVGDQVAESLRHHLGLSRAEARARAIELLDSVGIPEARRRYRHLPHQFSGGMAQRVMLAMVLGPEPDLLVADEPTAALDVTVQAQILDLFASLQRERSLAILMISHDLGAVASLADRVLIMYDGEVVEEGTSASVFGAATHEYTKALLNATPRLEAGPTSADDAATTGSRA